MRRIYRVLPSGAPIAVIAETNPAYLQVSYHYDVQGCTNAASAGNATLADCAGRLIDRILSNGAVTHYEWDEAGRLNRLKNTTGTGQAVNDTQYTRDHLGHILSQTETVGPNPGATTFSYDPNYRLLTADYPGTAHDEVFSYDKVGNRKTHTRGSLTPNAATRHYSYDTGYRLQNIRIGSPTGTFESEFNYDDNGNLLTETGPRAKTIVWSAQQRPSAINGSQFQYDPNGYRIRKTTGEQTQNYYLEGEHLEAIYDGDGRLTAQYLRGAVIDEVVNGYQKDGNNKLVNTTYHHDALQSVLGQSGHEGSVLTAQSYGAFGNVISQTVTGNNRLKYTGREEDSTGLYYYRARYYDPFIGRFISEDPLGFNAGDVNFYAYVGNNPVNANDPSGLCGPATPACIGAVIGGISAGASAYNAGATGLNLVGAIAGGAVGGAIGTYSIGAVTSLTALSTGTVAGGIGGSFGNFFGQVATGTSLAAVDTNQIITQGIVGALSAEFGFIYATTSGVPAAVVPALSASAGGAINTVANLFVPSNLGGFGTFANNGSANGGFVLYPNKSNTNQMQGVYSKH